MYSSLPFFLSSTLIPAADNGVAAKEIMLSWGAITVAAEKKKRQMRWKTEIYVREDVLNHDAIVAIENIHRL